MSRLPTAQNALARLRAIPSATLFTAPTPVEEMPRLRDALGVAGGTVVHGNAPRLFIKRDDAIPFGFGGNKVRKMQLVAADALRVGADTLVTVGGVQSNHARATAATAAKLGLRCVLVQNGAQPDQPRANALLNQLLGAEIEYVSTREERAPGMRRAAERVRSQGRTPYEVPLGASTPVGAAAFALAVGELLSQTDPPDVIVHASSSGGTQAGIVAGCALHGLETRVIGISADDPAASVETEVRRIVAGVGDMLGLDGPAFAQSYPFEVDDTFVGDGYGIATVASREAQALAARNEAIFVDNTYTAKALAALVQYAREGRFANAKSVLFWHTGGQVGIFV